MTPSQLLDGCGPGDLDDILEYDATDPPMTRRDWEMLFAALICKVHNASGNYVKPLQVADVFQSLAETQEQRLERLRREDRVNQILAKAQAKVGQSDGRPDHIEGPARTHGRDGQART